MANAQRVQTEAVANAQRMRTEAMANAQRMRTEAMANRRRAVTQAMAYVQRAQRVQTEAMTNAQRVQTEAVASARRVQTEAMANAQRMRTEAMANRRRAVTEAMAHHVQRAQRVLTEARAAHAQRMRTEARAPHMARSQEAQANAQQQSHGAENRAQTGQGQNNWVVIDGVRHQIDGPKIDARIEGTDLIVNGQRFANAATRHYSIIWAPAARRAENRAQNGQGQNYVITINGVRHQIDGPKIDARIEGTDLIVNGQHFANGAAKHYSIIWARSQEAQANAQQQSHGAENRAQNSQGQNCVITINGVRHQIDGPKIDARIEGTDLIVNGQHFANGAAKHYSIIWAPAARGAENRAQNGQRQNYVITINGVRHQIDGPKIDAQIEGTDLIVNGQRFANAAAKHYSIIW
ncbi:hypothetical protein niasHT_034694 [Heterodera trifolii]|uniref:Uncharacterized protein n=1 Tax=Heterodera trifolii TaxID=157864 RepID=A0ABD2IN78_9BILA